MKDIRHTLILSLLLLFTMAATNVYAQQEDAEALFQTGVRYESGDSVEKDLKTAIEWFEKAAAKGHAVAQNRLGVYYLYGEGVEQDLKKAVEWFKKSAALGYASAQ